MATPRLPSPTDATLSGALAGLLLGFLDARGLAARACRARLTHWRPDGRIPAVEWARCLQLIQAEHPHPALGLEIAQYIQPEHAGPLAYLALACDDMGELMAQLERFHRLMWQGFAVEVLRSDADITLRWTPYQAPPPAALDIARLAFETGIAGIVHLFRMLAGKHFTPAAVTLLGAAPADRRPYDACFGCPVSFSAGTSSLTYRSADLRMPIHTRNSALRQLVERQALAQLRAIAPTDVFLAGFRPALLRALNTGTPTLAVVAAELGLSRASLQRRLQARDTSFQQALDRVRFEMAMMYLENPGLSLTEIGLLLAFSEQSAFCRAFRRWSGQTPRAFRARPGRAMPSPADDGGPAHLT
ncbi:MAG: AraC family transcriptional regulator ligand-binding domain-containing protein [Moraxellaceae bacterium]|nr:AraC family transcriptional regulator ligand-binding domain-containing protein [Moraxellaceae bacterium]